MSGRCVRKIGKARPVVAGPLCVGAMFLSLTSSCSKPFPVERRTFADLDDFVANYWQRPIPLQGQPPTEWSTLETSLDPVSCGACHAQQYRDWESTIHAAAYSPGFSGQLVNNMAPAQVRACLVCHAPLSEQAPRVHDVDGRLRKNPRYDLELKKKAVMCAGCHVRGWRRYGAPRRGDGSLAASPPGSPHGGVTRTKYFEDSRFCASCHQFQQPAPNGKSLQNTYQEWVRSRYAQAGITCQSCHMPDRRHIWRGIHDSAMVAQGVTIDLVRRRNRVTLTVANTGTGHRFPTYVTPEVLVRIELLDADRQPLEGLAAELKIGRRVQSTGSGWIELSDTRLPPDSSATLTMSVTGSRVRYARGAVVVYPDAFYRGLFEGMLRGSLTDTSRTLIIQAYRHAGSTAVMIFDDTVPVRRAAEIDSRDGA